MQEFIQYDLVTDAGVEHTCFGHRLVASAFRPGGLADDDYVYHVDGNTTDNAYTNLRVLTPAELAEYTTSDLPGETWFAVASSPNLRRAMRGINGAVVSNVGRVNVRGRKSFGSRAADETPTFKHKGSTRSVALAVCTAFCGPCPDPDAHVVHLDGNCANTHPLNLKWSVAAAPPGAFVDTIKNA